MMNDLPAQKAFNLASYLSSFGQRYWGRAIRGQGSCSAGDGVGYCNLFG